MPYTNNEDKLYCPECKKEQHFTTYANREPSEPRGYTPDDYVTYTYTDVCNVCRNEIEN